MENLAHSLAGVVLARVGLKEKVPFGTAALVVAANLPDADSVASFGGSLYYFTYHRGITHSIFGAAVLGFFFASALWIANRRRKKPKKVTFAGNLASICAVLVTHPLMDFTNSYGWRPFLPFQDRWYYGDLVFIVDPYLWILLGGAVFLTAERTPVSRPFWVAAIIFISYLIIVRAMSEPELRVVPVIWFLSIVIFFALKRQLGLWSDKVLYLALSAVLFYWVFLFAAHQYALSLAAREVAEIKLGARKEGLSALPRLANPLSWEVFFQDGENVYHSRVSLTGSRPAFRAYARNLAHPAVQAALATCPGAVMSHFARFEFFQVIERGGGPLVILRDARFARDAPSGFGVLRIPLSSDLKNHKLATPCPRSTFQTW